MLGQAFVIDLNLDLSYIGRFRQTEGGAASGSSHSYRQLLCKVDPRNVSLRKVLGSPAVH